MKTTTKAVFTGLLAVTFSIPAGAQGHAMSGHDMDEHAAHRRMMEKAAAADMDVEIELRDLELVDQYGKKVRFKSDVIADKLVAMTFTYSTCTTICPIYSALFTRLQELLGDRMEREVVLVTLTLDPATDIPLRLKREAAKYRAEPGWFFLTGEKKNVDEVLKGVDAYFPDFTQHPPMAIVGDGRTGVFRRYNGFPQPEQLVAMLDAVRASGEGGGE